ncbi:MAG: two-component sensor histidine kinase, partial [Rhodobacterales bacterium]|nr:two-component sensor histidine kinase [Rhodobacterales bacterium]MDX5500320.1 two-component sensor histidine kinase [Rhodobacterales bacterium]
MTGPRSLQGRLGVWLGAALVGLWVAAASVTALIARGETEEVFDSALQETAQRILPLAVVDILNREEAGISQRLAAIRDHDEFFTYVVRDDQ